MSDHADRNGDTSLPTPPHPSMRGPTPLMGVGGYGSRGRGRNRPTPPRYSNYYQGQGQFDYPVQPGGYNPNGSYMEPAFRRNNRLRSTMPHQSYYYHQDGQSVPSPPVSSIPRHKREAMNPGVSSPSAGSTASTGTTYAALWTSKKDHTYGQVRHGPQNAGDNDIALPTRAQKSKEKESSEGDNRKGIRRSVSMVVKGQMLQNADGAPEDGGQKDQTEKPKKKINFIDFGRRVVGTFKKDKERKQLANESVSHETTGSSSTSGKAVSTPGSGPSSSSVGSSNSSGSSATNTTSPKENANKTSKYGDVMKTVKVVRIGKKAPLQKEDRMRMFRSMGFKHLRTYQMTSVKKMQEDRQRQFELIPPVGKKVTETVSQSIPSASASTSSNQRNLSPESQRKRAMKEAEFRMEEPTYARIDSMLVLSSPMKKSRMGDGGQGGGAGSSGGQDVDELTLDDDDAEIFMLNGMTGEPATRSLIAKATKKNPSEQHFTAPTLRAKKARDATKCLPKGTSTASGVENQGRGSGPVTSTPRTYGGRMQSDVSAIALGGSSSNIELSHSLSPSVSSLCVDEYVDGHRQNEMHNGTRYYSAFALDEQPMRNESNNVASSSRSETDIERERLVIQDVNTSTDNHNIVPTRSIKVELDRTVEVMDVTTSAKKKSSTPTVIKSEVEDEAYEQQATTSQQQHSLTSSELASSMTVISGERSATMTPSSEPSISGLNTYQITSYSGRNSSASTSKPKPNQEQLAELWKLSQIEDEKNAFLSQNGPRYQSMCAEYSRIQEQRKEVMGTSGPPDVEQMTKLWEISQQEVQLKTEVSELGNAIQMAQIDLHNAIAKKSFLLLGGSADVSSSSSQTPSYTSTSM